MAQVFIACDSSYKHNRHVGPFARILPGEYIGVVIPGKGVQMYPHELTCHKTEAYVEVEGAMFPLAIKFRHCLN